MGLNAITKFLTVLSLVSSFSSYALTDAEALADGMTLIDQAFESSQSSRINNPLRKDIESAIQQNRLVIVINKRASGADAQTLKIYENGIEVLKTKVSTGREKTEDSVSGRKYFSTTPKGFFRPTKAYTDYLSYTWNAQMPNSIFFIGGVAIHATGKSYYPQLGTRASGGCVRTTQEVSELIREKVMDTGRGAMAGMFKIINEAKGRKRISNNTVSVPRVDRSTGAHLNATVQSWDTVIIVHDQI